MAATTCIDLQQPGMQNFEQQNEASWDSGNTHVLTEGVGLWVDSSCIPTVVPVPLLSRTIRSMRLDVHVMSGILWVLSAEPWLC